MKIADIKIGMICKEGRFNVEVVDVYAEKFEVRYISGACYYYTQKDLDNDTIIIMLHKFKSSL